jgi:hypothetical protein
MYYECLTSEAEMSRENLLISDVDGRTDRHDKTNTFLQLRVVKA